MGMACLSAFPLLGFALVVLVRRSPAFAAPSTSNARSSFPVGILLALPVLLWSRSLGKVSSDHPNGITAWLDSLRGGAGKSPRASTMTTWPARRRGLHAMIVLGLRGAWLEHGG